MDAPLNTTERVANTRARRDAERIALLWNFVKIGAAGWSCNTVAAVSGLSRPRARRVVTELARQGLVEQVTPHRRVGGGSESATWRLTDAGRRRQDTPIIRTRP